MGSDAGTVNPSAPVISKDVGKKKKNNRSARLKQCKLDARREQWLSQVKNKGCKVRSDDTNPPSPYPVSRTRIGNQEGAWGDSIKIRPKKEDNVRQEDLHDSDTESLLSSPTSSSSGLGYSIKNCNAENGSSCSSSSSSSNRVSYTRGVNVDKEDDDDDDEEEESGGGGDGSFDDWEAIADSLTIDGPQPQDHPKPETNVNPISPSTNDPHNQPLEDSGDHGILRKPEPRPPSSRAWRPDDALRPRTLPSLSKQHSFPNMERNYGIGKMDWSDKTLLNQQSSCPICYEDLDLTDSSFLPCSCGFHLCLFCHKRILEADGRCPACRKQYSPVTGVETITPGGGMALSFHMSRSVSMSSRS